MNDYKEQLLTNIEKRFKTTMIGALARFEESFGYLWEDDSEKRIMFEKIWDETRNSILNNGNNQLRAAIDELSDYVYNERPRTSFKQKYHYKFFFNNENRNNGGRYEN
jgi:hypothetical protein